MDRDPLIDLLRAADRAAGRPPRMPNDLAARVRRAALVRERPRMGIGLVAASLVFAAGLIWVIQTARPITPAKQGKTLAEARTADFDEASLRTEIARLRAQAEAQLAVIDRLHANQKRRAQLAALRRPLTGTLRSYPRPVRDELENTAFVIVNHADQLRDELGLNDAAQRSYRRAIQLFPDSRWAEVARQRLNESEHTQGETS